MNLLSTGNEIQFLSSLDMAEKMLIIGIERGAGEGKTPSPQHQGGNVIRSHST